jgi:hypothetical protein
VESTGSQGTRWIGVLDLNKFDRALKTAMDLAVMGRYTKTMDEYAAAL